jgi:hypothetical protein
MNAGRQYPHTRDKRSYKALGFWDRNADIRIRKGIIQTQIPEYSFC